MNRKKNRAAAAALAAGLATAGFASAAPGENYIPAETQEITIRTPIFTNGRLSGHSETTELGLAERKVAACVQDKAGNDHTVRLKFVLAVSADDLKIERTGRTDREIADELKQKMTPQLTDKAIDEVRAAWQQAVNGYTLEQITAPSGQFIVSVNNMVLGMINDQRVAPERPSFEEKTGISIFPARPGPGSVTPGC